MKSLKTYISSGLTLGSRIPVCDNSGAQLVKITSVLRKKTRTGKRAGAGIADIVTVSVVKGNLEMRKKVVFAVIVRQRMCYRRSNGMRVKFEDNAAVVLKDEKGSPKGTLFKGPIAKEAAERWPDIAKVAKIIV